MDSCSAALRAERNLRREPSGVEGILDCWSEKLPSSF